MDSEFCLTRKTTVTVCCHGLPWQNPSIFNSLRKLWITVCVYLSPTCDSASILKKPTENINTLIMTVMRATSARESRSPGRGRRKRKGRTRWWRPPPQAGPTQTLPSPVAPPDRDPGPLQTLAVITTYYITVHSDCTPSELHRLLGLRLSN